MIPLRVRRFERLGDLPGDRQRLVERMAPRALRSASVPPSASSIIRESLEQQTSAVEPALVADFGIARALSSSRPPDEYAAAVRCGLGLLGIVKGLPQLSVLPHG